MSRQQKPDLCAGDCRSKVRFLFGLDPYGVEHLLQLRIVGKHGLWRLRHFWSGSKGEAQPARGLAADGRAQRKMRDMLMRQEEYRLDTPVDQLKFDFTDSFRVIGPAWVRAKTLRAETWNFAAQRPSTCSLSGNKPQRKASTTDRPCSLDTIGMESDSGYASGALRH